MGCHKCLIYTRMLVYFIIVATHATNGVVLLFSFSEEALKIKEVRDLHDTQFFFFTAWNFVVQAVFAGFSFFCDWLSLKDTEKNKVLPDVVTNFREKAYTVLVWPACLMVSSVFWTMYTYDRSLLYPESFDLVISYTSNHIMHTMILVFALCELVLFPRRKPDNSIVRICCIIAYEALYVGALYYIHYTKDIWIYPVFSKLNENPLHVFLFLCLIASVLIISYYVQFLVSNIVFKCRQKIVERYCTKCNK